jgi:spermidine synthase
MVQAHPARLPLLLPGHARSVVCLGLGPGLSVSGSLPWPDLQRSAVELSQGAITAAETWFKPVNLSVLDQTKITRDDARHFLSATADNYDVIIGDVFHPDLAGVSSMLSLQQFTRAKNRLTEDGLFVQWLALNQFDPDSLRVVLRTFRRAFPDARVFLDGMHLALVGAKNNFPGATASGNMNAAQMEQATGGEGIWTWLGRYCGLITEDHGEIQDEWRPVIEFRLPRARYNGQLDVAATLDMVLHNRPDMQSAMQQLGIAKHDETAFEPAYAATEFMGRSWLAAMHGNAIDAARLMRLAYSANPQDHWVQYALADSMYASLDRAKRLGLDERQALEKILQLNPRHVESLRALWRLQIKTHDAAAESTRRRLLAISPLDREAGECCRGE